MKRKKFLQRPEDQEYVESLHCAIFEEKMEHVKDFLKKGADVNALDDWGVGCLHYAVQKGRSDILRLLIQHGADLNVKDKREKKTAFVWAMDLRQIQCLKVLKECGVDLRRKSMGKAPIHMAVLLEAESVVRFLLENGARANDLCDDAMSPLEYACRHYKFKVVKYILDKGGDVNYCSPESNGVTPLHVAVFVNNLDVTCQLLGKGANANAYCQERFQTPTHCAAALGFQNILECLRSFDADLQAKTKNLQEDQPLHLAAQFGHLEVVQFLVDSGAPVKAANGWGFTPLHAAVLAGHNRVVQYLLQHTPVDIPTDPRGVTPLNLAVQTEFLTVIMTLLAKGANPFIPDYLGFTPIHTAARHNNVTFLEIVSAKFSFNDYFQGVGTLPLMTVAAKNNHRTVVNWLHRRGVPCDVTDYNGMTGMHHAASLGYTDMVNLLIRKGGNCNVVDKLGHTPLYYAVVHGWEHTVRTLILARATFYLPHPRKLKTLSDLEPIMCQMKLVMPYVEKRSGTTPGGHKPIYYAIMGGMLSNVLRLLDDGVDVNETNDFGATPLMCSVAFERLDHMQLLLNRGADANRGIVTLDNRTALHIAALTGKISVIRMLLDHGAVVDPVTRPEGRTPLFWAVCTGYVDVVKLLVESGANVLHKDAEGHIPISIAILTGNTDIASYLGLSMMRAQCSPGA